MNRILLFLSVAATASAWLLIRNADRRTIPVQDAAARLQQAWADNHTTA